MKQTLNVVSNSFVITAIRYGGFSRVVPVGGRRGRRGGEGRRGVKRGGRELGFDPPFVRAGSILAFTGLGGGKGRGRQGGRSRIRRGVKGGGSSVVIVLVGVNTVTLDVVGNTFITVVRETM